MRTITQKVYTYVASVMNGEPNFIITETATMENVGWLMIDEREISIEVEDIDYSEVIKQKEIDTLLAKQEKVNADLLELTS